MEIESTPLWDEVQKVFSNGSTTANYAWEVLIHYGENKDKEYSPLAVVAVNNVRDFVDAFADERTITVTMGLGDYARTIYPNRTNIDITLSKVPLYENSSAVDSDSTIQSERFPAILLDGDRSPTVGQGQESNDVKALNLTQIIDVNFQIYDKSIEQIKAIMVGTTPRNCTVQDAITTLVTNGAGSVDVDGDRVIEGVDFIDADNQDVKKHVIINHGTRLVDLPDFIQKKYGIYNSGMGTYIQNKLWHIYPLYDTSIYSNVKKTLNVIILPKRKFMNIERTFNQDGDVLTVLVTGETGFRDTSGSAAIAAGNGARFANADVFFESPSTTANNKTTITRNDNNAEFISDKATNGVNMAPVVPDRITSNPFEVYSALAARRGGMFRMIWENSDSSLIYPGMPVKVSYVDGDNISELYGIVHKAINVSHKLAPFGTSRFMHQTALHLFMNNQITEITS